MSGTDSPGDPDPDRDGVDDEWGRDPDPDPDLDLATRLTDLDPLPLVVGCFVAAAGALFLAAPYVDPVPVGEVDVPPVLLSVVVLSFGLSLGGVGYLRRGQRLVGLGHAVGGMGWFLVATGTVLAAAPLLFGGFAVLLGGSAALVASARPRR